MVRKIRFIMRTMPGVDINRYQRAIPGLELCIDKTRNAFDTFNASLDMAGNDPCVHLEDDIILCDHFCDRVINEIMRRPKDVIQFFSMRKDDLTLGSRYINGSLFKMNQCYYIPAGMGPIMLDYSLHWPKLKDDPTGYDIMMADFFKLNKVKYWNVVPNLVDHMVCKSRIDPRRSSKRQSFTFEG